MGWDKGAKQGKTMGTGVRSPVASGHSLTGIVVSAAVAVRTDCSERMSSSHRPVSDSWS